MPTTLSFDELHALTPESDPFSRVDRIVAGYMRKLVRLFSKARSRMSREDELYSFMTIVYGLYDDAWRLYAGCLEDSYAGTYGALLPGRLRDGGSAAFSAFASSYATPEQYVPKNEWQRKRDRAFESVATTWHDGRPIRAPVEQARNAVARQFRQGADDMAVQAIRDAYAAAGVERVMWVTREDARVCANCSPLDRRTYELGSLPPWPAHYNCRCIIVPAA